MPNLTLRITCILMTMLQTAAGSEFKNIFEAAEKGTVNDVRFFLDRGVDVNAVNEKGNTPLHRAAALNRDPEVLKFLIDHGADIHAKDAQGMTAFQLTYTTEKADILRRAGAEAVFRDFFDAVRKGTVDEIRVFIDRGEDVNSRVARGMTAIFDVVEFRSDTDVLKYLIEIGADVNIKHGWGDTPLHRAARHTSNPEILKILVAHGAEINAPDHANETPLHAAVKYSPHVAVLQTLLELGADIHAVNDDGKTPIDCADTEEKRDILRAAVPK